MTPRFRFEHGLVAAGIAFLVMGALLVGGTEVVDDPDRDKAEAGQSRAFSRLGVRALASTLQRCGAEVGRFERRYDLLPDDLRVLVIVTPPEAPDKDELDALVEWIRKGHTVVLFPDEASADLVAALGWRLEPGRQAPSTCRVNYLERDYALSVATESRLAAGPAADPSPHPFGQDELGWVGSWIEVGRGVAFAFADPAIPSNGGLATADHAPFLVTLLLRYASGGKIAFDEYHHGWDGGQTLTGYLMDSPAKWILVHALGVLLLVTLGRGRRLGPAFDPRIEQRRRPIEFIQAFARLCRTAGTRGLAVSLVLTELREAMTRRYGAFDGATVKREAARRGLDGERLAKGLSEARAAATKSSLPAAEMIAHQRLLDEIRSLIR